MKVLKVLALSFIGTLVVVGCGVFLQNNPKIISYENMAAVFFQKTQTIAQLNQKYKITGFGNKVKVLVVPGHEPGYGGAEFGGLKERNMTVDLGNYLVGFLNNNSHYETTITRDRKNWNQVFSDYFASNWDSIITFVQSQKLQMQSLKEGGSIKAVSGAFHTNAPQDVALRLYGINKWANENNIDIEIHIHFNDYPRSKQSLPGKYSGLTIYVPEQQYSNSTTTKAIAASVFARLSKYNAVSNLGTENAGVVEDQDLIAIGSDNNANAASMLIEYGYIYEPQFQDSEIRDMALRDLAYQTYLGLEDFFDSKDISSIAYDTLMLPYKWQKNISKTDIFALQSALAVDGEYPVLDQSKNDCPRSGVFGSCTRNALSAFQNKYNIKGEKGVVGVKTIDTLNSMFGS